MNQASTIPLLRPVEQVVAALVKGQKLSRKSADILLRYATKWVLAFTGTAGTATPDLGESIARLYAVEGLPPPAEVRWCRDPFELEEAIKRLAGAETSTPAPQARESGGWEAMLYPEPKLSYRLARGLREIKGELWEAVTGPWRLTSDALRVHFYTTGRPRCLILHPWSCETLLRWDLAVHEEGIASPAAADAVRIMEATPCAAFFPEASLLLERPAVFAFDENGRLHREDGPAVRWGPAENPTAAVYALRGRRVPPEVIEGGLDPKEFHEYQWCREYLIRRHGLLWLARSEDAWKMTSQSHGMQRWTLVQVPILDYPEHHPITCLILEDRATGAIWSTRLCLDKFRKETRVSVPFTAAVWRER